jgi:conjugal transfer mating pair stabilization protein TraG
MAPLPVVTFGGGEDYRDVFVAVALMTGTGAMASLVRVGLLLGLVWGLLRMMGDLKPGRVLRWFLFAAMTYGCVFVPKVQVRIVDRFNPALTGALVANVPLGVAFAESLASKVGARMIDMTETAFGDPLDLEYSQTGMIYGAKFMESATRARYQDQTYEENLEAFFRNCVFYDVNDNLYTIDSLAKTNDLWAFLSDAAHAPNPARSTPFILGDGPAQATTLTCDKAFQSLQLNAQAEAKLSLETVERGLNPGMADADLATKGLGVLGAMLGASNAASTDALTTMTQVLTLNALQNAAANNPTGTGAGSALAQAQADVQTENTGALLAHVGESSIVTLKIVIDLLFVGMFPILFPLFLLPQVGLKALQSYWLGFAYLQVWGPMYVIVHKIIMTAAEAQMGAVANLPGNPNGPGFSLLTLSGVDNVNAGIQTVASMMIIMIPVIAGALTKGAMAVGSQGEALLQPFRSGAESAAAAQATGNWSYGATNVDTHAFHTVSGNRLDTSGSLDQGFVRYRTANDDEVSLDRSRHVVAGRVAPHDTAASLDQVLERAQDEQRRASARVELSRTYDQVASTAQQDMHSRIHEAAFARASGSDDRTSVANAQTDTQTSGLAFITGIRDEAIDKFHVSRGWAQRAVEEITRSAQDSYGLTTDVSGGTGSGTAAINHGTSWTTSDARTASGAHSSEEQRALDYMRARFNSADTKRSLERANTQSLNRSIADYNTSTHTTADKAVHSVSSTRGFTEAQRDARTAAVSAERSASSMQRLAETVRRDHGADFFQFGMQWLERGPDKIERSAGERMSILNGRGDRRLLDDTVDAYVAQRMPHLSEPAPLNAAESQLGPFPSTGEPWKPGGAPAPPAGSPRHSVHHADGDSGTVTARESADAAVKERARAAGLQLPSADREIRPDAALGDTQRDLAREVKDALERPIPTLPRK